MVSTGIEDNAEYSSYQSGTLDNPNKMKAVATVIVAAHVAVHTTVTGSAVTDTVTWDLMKSYYNKVIASTWNDDEAHRYNQVMIT